MKEIKQENFSNRYIVKILSSILIAILNIIVQLLLPRIFSIEEYGFYSYNLNVFTSVVTIFNLSSSDAMVSKFSKSNEEKGYVYFYLNFYAVISLLLNFGVLFLFNVSVMRRSFAGQTLTLVLFGLNAAIVRKLLTDVVSIFDAMALSRLPAVWQIIQKILITFGVVLGYFIGVLHLFVFYILQITTILFVSIILFFLFSVIHKKQYKLSVKKIYKEYLAEFTVFCRPLIFATVFTQFIIIIKNWALMRWSGITSSALFGAAWQLNVIISYIFSPYAELMKREFAVIHDNHDMLRHRILQSLKIMAWLISFFCIFIAVFASDILLVLFGNQYSNAVFITQLIMLYTIYQAWGQIFGSFLLAVEETKLSSIISMVVNVFSLLLVYFFQCPNFIWAKGLGTTGMGLSYVIANVFSVSLTLYFISKKLQINFFKVFIIPINAILLCIFCAFVPYMILNKVLSDRELLYGFIRILSGGIFYCSVLFTLLWNCPKIIGIDKSVLVQKLTSWRHK